MRRVTVPRESTTKPVVSPCRALLAAVAWSESEPGTETLAGAETVVPPAAACVCTLTAQGPAPPPASVSETGTVAESPRWRNRNETSLGAAKTKGVSAAWRSIRPPPSRVGSTSWRCVESVQTGWPVITSADLTCAGVQVGCRWSRSAAPPATCGDAMLVPLKLSQPLGTDE